MRTTPRPDWIPYRTSYYDRTWGFCLSRGGSTRWRTERTRSSSTARSRRGRLPMASACCLAWSRRGALHDARLPSVARERQSLGDCLLTELAAALAAATAATHLPAAVHSRHYRLHRLARAKRRCDRPRRRWPRAGLRRGSGAAYLQAEPARRALIDRAASHVIGRSEGGRVHDFVPWGWDERQFNSPGFDLPVGCLTRSAEGEFPEYHSSADDLSLISSRQLEHALEAVLEIADVLESDRAFVNLLPRGEPQLGKRGLYRATGGAGPGPDQLALLWVLNQSDGNHALLDIAERSGLTFPQVYDAARRSSRRAFSRRPAHEPSARYRSLGIHRRASLASARRRRRRGALRIATSPRRIRRALVAIRPHGRRCGSVSCHRCNPT